MLRFVFGLAVMAAAGALAIDLAPPEARRVEACSVAPVQFDDTVRAADFIVVATVIEVGGAANEQPPLPSATATQTGVPDASSTPELTPTRTPRNQDSPTPEDTELAEPSATPFPAEDLTGLRAVLEPVVVYAGGEGGQLPRITVDAASRKAYEEELRRREALMFPRTSCSPTAPFRYELGRAYFVMGRTLESGAVTTFVVPMAGESTLEFPANSCFQMHISVYERFLSRYRSEFVGSDRGCVFIDRITLGEFSPALLAIRAGISPPETGSGGMAALR